MLKRRVYDASGHRVDNNSYKFTRVPWYVDCDCGSRAERKASKANCKFVVNQ